MMTSPGRIQTNIFLLFFFIITSMFGSILSQNIHYITHRDCSYSFMGTPGIALVDFVIENTHTKTLQKCALACLSRRRCASFNYQDFTDLCQLNSASRACVPPKHVVFNGTMRHFSPPISECWQVIIDTLILKLIDMQWRPFYLFGGHFEIICSGLLGRPMLRGSLTPCGIMYLQDARR